MSFFKYILSFLILQTFFLQAQPGDPNGTLDSLRFWKKKFSFGLNFNQASFSSNWKAGGVSSIGLNTGLVYKADYKKGKIKWDNEIDFLFGFVNSSGLGYQKTQDRLYLDTKFGLDLNDKWSLFSALNLLSQFANGHHVVNDSTKNLISDFFAPAFITSTWGMEYMPVSYFKLRISPFSPRITFVQDPQRFVATVAPNPYGVQPPSSYRTEWLAFQLLADFHKALSENVNLKWRYVLFANYETFSLRTIDHRIDLQLSARINKFLQMGMGGIFLYDFDQDPGAQISQMFTLGFLYSYQNYKEEK